MLSPQTTHKIASALTPEVIEYIMRDERYVELMHEIIPDAIEEKLGKVDTELQLELAFCIMDNILLKAWK